MPASCKSFIIPALLVAAATVQAQEIVIDVPAARSVQIAENRRNPGEISPIAMGDVDGDGLEDCVMGAPRAGGLLTVDSGMIYIRFGGDYLGLPPASDDGGVYYDLTSRPDAVVTPQYSAVTFADSLGRIPSGVQIFPERGGEFFGSSVATGDFNNDNFADILIGAPHPLGDPDLGTVYLILGRADLGGLTYVEDEIFNANAVEIKGRYLGARFGEVVEFADLDNDGFDDILIGTPRAATGGTVDIIYGRPVLDWSRATIDSVPNPKTRIFSNVADERFGSAITAGDFNGDNFPELVIGAPRWPIPVNANGRVVVLEFSGGRPASIDMSVSPPYLTVEMTLNFAGLGGAVAVGDLDNDGVDDLIASAPQLQVGTRTNLGGVYHISNPSQYAGDTLEMPFDSDISIFGTGQSQEFFGWSLAVGAYDIAPGIELLVGAPGKNTPDGTAAGAVFVYRSGALPATSILEGELGYQISQFRGTVANFRYGTDVAIGQFDGLDNGDIFASGSGDLPFDSSCGGDVLADWQICHDGREGIRVYGVLAGSVPQAPIELSAKPGWMMME
ncbi:FG-GAP repeat protein [bacterium]|nr:FG-GAP repeat protein [bacterium]